MMWVAVAIAGGLGAASRYVLDHAVTARRASGSLPWGTLLVNVTGSLAAGVVAGLVASGLLPTAWQVAVAGGFLGAYTTFSTAMHESLLLLETGERPAAVVNLLVPLVVAPAAAMAGWWTVG